MFDFSKVKQILDEGEQQGAGPGRGLVLYYKHQPVFRYVTGYKDKEQGISMQGDTIVNLFSCSKVMTCTAALMLWERGAYQLDDEVGKYIPEFYNVTVDGKAAEKPILVRHLFTMSAGLNYTLDDEVIKAAGEATDNHFPTLETIRFLTGRPLEFQPGDEFLYSLCHDALGALIEVWSGMSFYEFVKSEILDPLGMYSTFYHVPEELEERKGVLYRYNPEAGCGKPCDQNNPYVLGDKYESGGAGVRSCLDDYIKFVEMLCNNGVTPDGRQLIKKETLDMMATPVFTDEWQEYFVQRVSWAKGYRYGLGVYIVDEAEKANSTAPKGTFGWDGAAGSYVSVDRENEIAVFYVQHMYGGTSHQYQDTLRNAVYEELLKSNK